MVIIIKAIIMERIPSPRNRNEEQDENDISAKRRCGPSFAKFAQNGNNNK
jgi:hypothetical protein